jgi:hypothetical protein
MKAITTAIFFLLAGFMHNLLAQGCSDAGFCSIDGIKPNNVLQSDSMENKAPSFANAVKTGLSIGNTRYSVWILNSYIGYSRQLNSKMTANLKIDGQFRTGDLTSVVGFSDITLSMSYHIVKPFTLVLGGKIPLSDANREYQGYAMPMAYQTSLGTYDVIFAAQYSHKNFLFALGWQQPLIQNDNSYLIGNISEEELGATYLETNQYKRAGDVLLRVSYKHYPQTRLTNFSFTYSLLPIYHLKNDKYTNTENNTVEINDSKGLTLNTNIFANYNINAQSSIELSTGFPVYARKVRPDGLSQFAVTIEFIRRF